MKIEKVRESIGKHIADTYNRPVGDVVGFTVDEKDDVTLVDLKFCSSEFLSVPVNQLQLESESLTLVPFWKSESNILKKEYRLTAQRLKALEELFSKEELSKDIYEELHKQYDDALKNFDAKVCQQQTELKNKIQKLDEQIKAIQTILAKIKVYHLTHEIGEEAYTIAKNQILNDLDSTTAEKNDVESMLDEIDRLNSEELSSNLPEQPSPETELRTLTNESMEVAQPSVNDPKPNDPLVVHLHEDSSL